MTWLTARTVLSLTIFIHLLPEICIEATKKASTNSNNENTQTAKTDVINPKMTVSTVQFSRSLNRTKNHNLVKSVIRSYTTGEYYCASCMSPGVERYWKYLKHHYHSQKSFTEDCDRLHGLIKAPVTKCNQPCVTLAFNMNLMGVSQTPLFIRGCSTYLVRQGFTEYAMAFLDNTNTQICRRFYLYEILNSITDEESLVDFCPCRGTRCNIYTVKYKYLNINSQNNSSQSNSMSISLILYLFLSLLIR